MNNVMVAMTALFLTLQCFAEEEIKQPSQTPKVKYKSGKDVNFEEMLIQGTLTRPEVTVITGQVDKGTDGLLRLRENFLDRIASDQGEALK